MTEELGGEDHRLWSTLLMQMERQIIMYYVNTGKCFKKTLRSSQDLNLGLLNAGQTFTTLELWHWSRRYMDRYSSIFWCSILSAKATYCIECWGTLCYSPSDLGISNHSSHFINSHFVNSHFVNFPFGQLPTLSILIWRSGNWQSGNKPSHQVFQTWKDAVFTVRLTKIVQQVEYAYHQ